jgi:hypothetical protein
VKAYQLAIVHAVQVIAGQDEHVLWFAAANAVDLTAHRVGCPLAPTCACRRFIGCQDLDRAAGKDVKLVGAVHVAMERSRERLGQDKDARNARVDTVADRDVDQAELAADGHRRLASRSGQRVQVCLSPEPKHDRLHVMQWHWNPRYRTFVCQLVLPT